MRNSKDKRYEPKFINLFKLDVAKRLLNKTIYLFFNEDDEVVIHLLAHSARDILSDLGKKKGIVSFQDQAINFAKPEYREFVRNTFRGPGNYFKHANQPYPEPFKFYYSATEYIIWEACEQFTTISNMKSSSIRAYKLWFYTKHYDILLEKTTKDMYKNIHQSVDYRNKKLYLKVIEAFDSFNIA